MIRILFVCCAFAVHAWGFAQTDLEKDKKEVQAVVDKLFEGMRKGDSTLVRSVFHPTARLQSIFTSRKTQKPMLMTEKDVNGFVAAVGKPHTEVWDERVLSYEIRLDEHMATVWTPYSFYLDNKLSHTGVNAFHLVRDEQNQWKITQITDTRRKAQ